MLALKDIPIFSGISERGLRFLERSADLRHFQRGSIICRKGESGLGLFAIASGGVQIHLDQEPTGKVALIHMGEGQIFGEMSVITDMPISANVIALDAHIYFMRKSDFLGLLETEPALQKALMEICVNRLRHRSSLSTDRYLPKCTLILFPSGTDSENLRNALCQAIGHYAPGSCFIDQVRGRDDGERNWKLSARNIPAFFPASSLPVCAVETQGGMNVWSIQEDVEWLSDLMKNWRRSGTAEQLLVLLLTDNTAVRLRDQLIRGDTATACMGVSRNQDQFFGLAEYCSVRRKSDHKSEEDWRQAEWSFQIDDMELDRAGNLQPLWDRVTCPAIDGIARWITHREIGIVLGAGAARGFAHLGVLEVLEVAGIPIDYACGTSMGGAIATIYGKTGNAYETTRIIRSLIGSNDKIRDLSWCPKSSLMAGRKLERAIVAATGGSTFAELRKQAAVLASDLVRREQIVFDRGSTTLALLATTAIPGIFPPVVLGNKVLVDGALLSRIPLDLLDKRRCGLKIAVNVVPSPDLGANQDELNCQRLIGVIDRFFGFRHVITHAWEILTWWHGTSEAEAADVLIEPCTNPHSGYDFDAVDSLIEAGREAARSKLGGIQRSLDSLLKPGIP